MARLTVVASCRWDA